MIFTGQIFSANVSSLNRIVKRFLTNVSFSLKGVHPNLGGEKTWNGQGR